MPDFSKISLNGTTYNVKDATARDVLEKTRYTVADYGIFPDGTDVTSKLQDLLDLGIPLIFNAGIYHLSEKLTLNAPMYITGAGTQNTVLLWDNGTSAGIEAHLTKIDQAYYYSNNFTITDITLGKATAVSDTALFVEGVETINDRSLMSPVIRNINITTYDASFSENGWLKGIFLDNCNCAQIIGCTINGSNTRANDQDVFNTYSGIEIETNEQYTGIVGTEFLITDCKTTATEYAIYAHTAEGLQITSCVLIFNDFGVFWTDGSNVHPHLGISNTHISSQICCVNVFNISCINITGNLFFLYPKQNDASLIASLESGSHFGLINSNILVECGPDNRNGTHGIVVGGTNFIISDNIISMWNGSTSTIGVWIQNITSRTHCDNNRILNADTDYLDQGSTNVVPAYWSTLNNVATGITINGSPRIEATAEGCHAHVQFWVNGGSTIAANTTLFKLPINCTVYPVNSYTILANGLYARGINVTTDGSFVNGSPLLNGENFQLDIFLRWTI